MTDVSEEVRAMANAERKKWLTVAEAQSLRKHWSELHTTLDKIADKFDANSENEADAQAFIVVATLLADGFTRAGSDAVRKLRDLMVENI